MIPITDIAQLDLSQTYTYANYSDWQFTEYFELLKGKVIPRQTPFTSHQQCLGALACLMLTHCKQRAYKCFMGPLDVRMPSRALGLAGFADNKIHTVVQPDISVICDLSKIDKRGCLGAPDWIIEIVSPSSIVLDTRTKFDLYAENGVREYWIAFPGEQAITAYHLTADGQYELSGTYAEPGPMPSYTLPELAIEWADIFEETK